MTLDEFLVKLRETPRDWYMNGFGIRGGNCCCCPITGCSSYGPRPAWDFHIVSRELGLSVDDMYAIADAADCRGGHNPALRAQLLAACGLAPDPK
jgi:hypothetical protein